MNRYHRQMLLPQIGEQGQARLAAARVLLVGCGALGTVLADQLVRAGVGTLRLVDRDVVEFTNLQRQVLFDEEDARQGTPKAVAAARRLGQINSQVRVEPFVSDVHAENVQAIAGLEDLEPGGEPAHLILDGTDNAETRFLLNDLAVKHGIPWVYGACVGTEGRVMAVRPPRTACLRCIFPQPPGPGELPTCDTAGVLGPAAAVVASLQAIAAIKLLTQPDGDTENDDGELVTLDVWNRRFRRTSLAGAKRPDCPTCGLGKYEFLETHASGRSVSLCGRNAIQVRPLGPRVTLDLAAVAERLNRCGSVQQTQHLVRCRLEAADEMWLTVFRDGRAIVQGTADPDRARSIYARWVGT